MKIETKYSIGDRVWVVYENQGEVSVYDTVIEEIAHNNKETYYFGKEAIDIHEPNMILYNDSDELYNKIIDLMNEIHEREKGADNIE
ncbi:MAG TPA: hypothetical protein DEP51_04115 [Clostridiales bacterium]|nr:hypothetical protein [Clostridiales bacterium]